MFVNEPQVGRDQGAQAFLKQLDDDAKVGKMIDCTSYAAPPLPNCPALCF